jgi:hypothetical protein
MHASRGYCCRRGLFEGTRRVATVASGVPRKHAGCASQQSRVGSKPRSGCRASPPELSRGTSNVLRDNPRIAARHVPRGCSQLGLTFVSQLAWQRTESEYQARHATRASRQSASCRAARATCRRGAPTLSGATHHELVGRLRRLGRHVTRAFGLIASTPAARHPSFSTARVDSGDTSPELWDRSRRGERHVTRAFRRLASTPARRCMQRERAGACSSLGAATSSRRGSSARRSRRCVRRLPRSSRGRSQRHGSRQTP